LEADILIHTPHGVNGRISDAELSPFPTLLFRPPTLILEVAVLSLVVCLGVVRGVKGAPRPRAPY